MGRFYKGRYLSFEINFRISRSIVSNPCALKCNAEKPNVGMKTFERFE